MTASGVAVLLALALLPVLAFGGMMLVCDGDMFVNEVSTILLLDRDEAGDF